MAIKSKEKNLVEKYWEQYVVLKITIHVIANQREILLYVYIYLRETIVMWINLHPTRFPN